MPFSRRKRPSPAPRLIPVAAKEQLGFDYLIRLSSRKSATIEVRPEEVRVSAPHRTAQRDLKQWVKEKAPWIREKLAEQQARQNQIPQRSYCEGARWPYRGRDLTLKLQSGPRACAQRQGDILLVCLSKRSRKPEAEQVAAVVQNWYQQQALTILTEKSEHVCEALGRSYRNIRLKRTKSKWGHCTIQGDLQYNWLIMQAPEAVIDYLVVHECCHLVHHNHSRQFWDLVAQHCPDYPSAKTWLRERGHQLTI